MVSRPPREAPDKWYYLLFLTTLALTPVCYLIVYANWSTPLFSAPFLGMFSRIAWLRISLHLDYRHVPLPLLRSVSRQGSAEGG